MALEAWHQGVAARRKKVIEAARPLFANNGFHRTGIAQIATRSGIAVGQIYRDFQSKEEIIATIVRENCAAFMRNDSLAVAIECGDQNSIRSWLRQFINHGNRSDEDERVFSEIVAESTRNIFIHHILEEVYLSARGSLIVALSLFAPSPVFSARLSGIADAIIAIFLGLMNQRLIDSPRDNGGSASLLTEFVERQIDELLRAQGELNSKS